MGGDITQEIPQGGPSSPDVGSLLCHKVSKPALQDIISAVASAEEVSQLQQAAVILDDHHDASCKHIASLAWQNLSLLLPIIRFYFFQNLLQDI